MPGLKSVWFMKKRSSWGKVGGDASGQRLACRRFPTCCPPAARQAGIADFQSAGLSAVRCARASGKSLGWEIRLPAIAAAIAFWATASMTSSAPPTPVPAPSQVYLLSPAFPKYVTCDIEFRDPTEKLWPNFFYGKPAGNGSIKNDPANPAGAFALICDQQAQKNGDQSRRVLGELLKPGGSNTVALTIARLGPAAAPAGVKPKDKSTFFATATGELQMFGRRLPINAVAEITPTPAGKGDEKNATLRVRMSFEIKAADLGLKNLGGGTIKVTASLNAYAPALPKP